MTTTNIDKFNFRLIRALQYLFSFNIVVRHKFDKFNVISNALSRLSNASQSNVKNKVEILNVLYDHFVVISNYELQFFTIQNISTIIYHVTFVKMSNDFKQRLQKTYAKNFQWKKIFFVITSIVINISKVSQFEVNQMKVSQFEVNQSKNFEQSSSNRSKINQSKNNEQFSRSIKFRLREKLIYYVFEDNDNKNRLCISTSLKQKIFRMTHDLNNYDDFHKIYDKLVNFVYVKHLVKRLRVYIKHCSQCQINQTKRHFFYDSLQSIDIFVVFFHIIAINFILTLSIMNDINCAFIVTCKFNKKNLIVFNKFIWDVENWVNVFIIAFMIKNWNILKVIINDRNRKFVSLFWRIVFRRVNVMLLLFTTYHFQTNEQFERTNQIIEIVFRFWLSNSKNIDWREAFFYLIAINNNVVNVIIDFVSNELAYEFRINDTLAMLKNLSTKNYNRLRQVKRKSVEKTMIFVNVMRKLRYDAVHIDLKLIVDDYAYLCLYNDYIIFDFINRKLNQQRIDFFKILNKIDTFAYRFQLSSIMIIHSVIFITQLKSSSSFNANFYRRSRFDVENPSSMQLKNDENNESKNAVKLYEVETLLNRRIIFIERVSYLIKWKKYDSQNNVWYSLHALRNFMKLMKRYDKEHSIKKRRRFVAVKKRRIVIIKKKRHQRRIKTFESQRRIEKIEEFTSTSSSKFSSSSSFASSLIIESRRFTRLLLKSISKKSEEKQSTIEQKAKKSWRKMTKQA